jgi:hypothetical protein
VSAANPDGNAPTPAATSVNVMLAGIPEAWAEIPLHQDDAASRVARTAVTRFLSDLLQSSTLMVLTGLGSSLCIDGAPTLSDLWTGVQALPLFAKVLADTRWSSTDDGDVELLLSKCEMLATIDHDSPSASFKTSAESFIFERCRFIGPDSHLQTHQDFLRRVARRASRFQRTQLFTTNYDLSFEAAATSLGYLIIDGFSFTAPRTFDASYFDYDFVRRASPGRPPEFVPEVFVLHKLHGSVNWDASSPRIIQADRPVAPALIFPRQSKYELSYELPFLESMSRFQSALRQPTLGLLVIGSGLQDKHIVEPLLACLRANATARIAVVDPSVRTSDSTGHRSFREATERGDQRVALINGTFDSFVSLLPDLVPLSEAERQEQVIRDLLVGRDRPTEAAHLPDG